VMPSWHQKHLNVRLVVETALLRNVYGHSRHKTTGWSLHTKRTGLNVQAVLMTSKLPFRKSVLLPANQTIARVFAMLDSR